MPSVPKRGRPKGSLNKNKERGKERTSADATSKPGSGGRVSSSSEQKDHQGATDLIVRKSVPPVIGVPLSEHTTKTLEHYQKVIETLPGSAFTLNK